MTKKQELVERIAEFKGYCTAIRKLITSLESELAQYQWIPVEKQLPKPDQTVIIYQQKPGSGVVTIGGFLFEEGIGEYWWNVNGDTLDDADNRSSYVVTHWHPLPEGPRDD